MLYLLHNMLHQAVILKMCKEVKITVERIEVQKNW